MPVHGPDWPGPHWPRPQAVTLRWKAALNAFDVRFEGRLSLGRI
jgi:hypothetical protein